MAAAAQPLPDDGTRDAARGLGQEGIEALWAGQFADADAKLERAYALFPTPTLGLWSARARQKLGRWVEAANRYRETIQGSADVGDNAAQHRAQLDAQAELEQLVPRIPTITLTVAGNDLEAVVVSVNGNLLPTAKLGTPQPSNPGVHTLSAIRGQERYEQRIELAEGQHFIATFSFGASARQVEPVSQPPAATPPAWTSNLERRTRLTAAPAPSPNRPQHPLMPIAVGAMVAGTASILASGLLAVVASANSSDACPHGVCTKAEDKQSYDSLQTASAITFYAGAAVAAGGFVGWLFLGPLGETRERSVGWNISPTGVAFSKKF